MAKVKGVITNAEMKQLRLGVMVDGRKTKEARVKLLEVADNHQSSRVRLTIHEGRHR